MIYIFKGFQGICSLPGYICSHCGDACKSCPGACKGVTEPFRKGCKSCGAEVKHFMERPLSAYVVLSVLISAFTLYQCSTDMASVEGCSSNFLYILAGFSVVNVMFAIYVQCQVWRTIMSEENQANFIDGDRPTETYKGQFSAAAVGMFAKSTSGQEQALAPAAQVEKVAADPGKIIVPKTIVQASFKQVFLEDFGVLIMFFALLCLFGLSWKGQDVVDSTEPKCTVSEMTQRCGFAFFWIAFLWTLMYMCCGCCSNKVAIAKPSEEEETYSPVVE